MLKNKLWIGIILSIILMAFSINGFTAYYKYTQESGTNFYVGTADKSDALEDTNEMRQIIDDLGTLLGHSKRNDLYPKDSTTGGYLGRLNCGINASKPAVPVVNDMYLATDTIEIYRCFVAGNWVKVYPEGGTTTFLGLTDTPANYTGQAGKYTKVNVGETALEFGTPAGVDTSGTPEANDIARFTDVDTIEGINYTELKTALALSSDDLSDVSSIAMLDENETITGVWLFNNEVYAKILGDLAGHYPFWSLMRARDGDPTYIVTTDDILGDMTFSGGRNETPSYGLGARIRGVAEGTFGIGDFPTRLEFWTTPDDSGTIALRLAIDNAGNIKMGDGAWTNYVNVSNAGAMTFEGTASIDISSDDLSDVASIGMLDEWETATGVWKFPSLYFEVAADANYPENLFRRSRDGDPTYIVQENDTLGNLIFMGCASEDDDWHAAAHIMAKADGEASYGDMPGRLEFWTTPDGSSSVVKRMEIDNAGNIKMGDGAWTNYIKVTAAGAMTAEGTATIKATDLVIANQAAGDILYFNGTNWIRLAIGTAGQILTVNAGGTAPEWQTP